MRRRAALGLGMAVTILVLTAIGCTLLPASSPQAAAGRPQPIIRISDLKLVAPERDGEPYRIEALINHVTSGGRAGITFRLRNKATEETYQTSTQMSLRPAVAVVAIGRVEAPRADYAPEVELQYPLR
jgi:hypothetical protein